MDLTRPEECTAITQEDQHVSGASIRGNVSNRQSFSQPYPVTVAGTTVPSSSRRNKSCYFCLSRKKKCDGDGRNRCSLCVSKGPGQECLYGTKRWHKPKTPRPQVSTTAVKIPGKRAANRAQVLQATEAYIQEMAGISSFKRCRLSASPATGLVGTEENAMLHAYFRCLGILPFASERMIREAMVRIMSTPTSTGEGRGGRSTGITDDDGSDGTVAWSMTASQARPRHRRRGQEGLGGVGGGAAELPATPDTCILWCAIALGAIMMGQQMEQVSRYVDRARDALGGFFDEGTIETARAYIVMAFLHNFLGDKAKNVKYVQFANGVVATMKREELPPELVELIDFEEHTSKISTNDIPHPKDPSETYNEALIVPKRSGTILKQDISSFMLYADRRVDHTFFRDIEEGEIANPLDPMWGHHPDHGEAPDGVINGAVHGPSQRARQLVEDLKQDMERIALAAERSDFCAGAGGLITYSNMAYLKMMDNDTERAFDDLVRCANILERFPGLCRYSTWVHMAHCLVYVYAISGHGDLYDKVAGAFNTARPDGFVRIPPREEWRAISDICHHTFCRSLCSTNNVGNSDTVTTDSSSVDEQGSTCVSGKAVNDADIDERIRCPNQAHCVQEEQNTSKTAAKTATITVHASSCHSPSNDVATPASAETLLSAATESIQSLEDAKGPEELNFSGVLGGVIAKDGSSRGNEFAAAPEGLGFDDEIAILLQDSDDLVGEEFDSFLERRDPPEVQIAVTEVDVIQAFGDGSEESTEVDTLTFLESESSMVP